jgi:hypothetical protein
MTFWQKLARRVERLPGWAIPLLIGAAALLAALIYLWPSYVEFPMDDSYIHMVYARNLAEQGRLIFSFADEQGVGVTSILWVLLLAGGHAVGLPMTLVAKLLGVASLAFVGVSLYRLLRPTWHPLPASAVALLVVLSGNMLWFALSGMETTLFLALGLLALRLYRAERWAWLGIALGLLALTRPEGLLLTGVIGCVDVFRRRRLGRGIVVSVLICLVLCLPWYSYLLWRTGHVLPTSAVGKQMTFSIATRYVLEHSSIPALLARLPWLIYIAAWLAYLLEFALGGNALPPPTLTVGVAAGSPGYIVSVWAFAGWALAAWLCFSALKRLLVGRRWLYWLREHERSPLMLLLLWAVLHNLSYMVFMPVPGTASRYGALNYLVLWIALVAGLLNFTKRPRLLLGLAGGLVIIAAANGLYWNRVYDANLEHMLNVRIAAANFVRDAFPAEELCAASDVGAVRYFSDRPILDLGALVDPNAGTWFQQGAVDRYLLKYHVTCLVLPGRTGSRSEGLFDIAEIMGLTTSPLFKMELIGVFEIDYQRWLLGYRPTTNYQASVTVYRLVPAGDTE